jgi:hypothetical protein
MIIHHNERIKSYQLFIKRPLKYSEKFTFIPIRLKKDKLYHKCIFQTPLLFTPYGINSTQNNKNIIDITFQNIENDNSQKVFHANLKYIYDTVYEKYKYDYIVNEFLKRTDFNDCLRLKISDNTILFDEFKNTIEDINNYSYGNFIIELEGLWLNEDNIWFQWNLLQAKIRLPTHLKEYSFIDEIQEISKTSNEDKYTKMIKMGVPKEAVDRQRVLDGNVPNKISQDKIPQGKIPPPPPPPNFNCSSKKPYIVPKIKASDLQNVILKKSKPIQKDRIKKNPNHFEPPTIEELQSTLSRLKKIKG